MKDNYGLRFFQGIDIRTQGKQGLDTPLRTKGVILPKTTLEVSKILQLCYEKNEEIIVHGGLTNLVGGTQVQPHQWVISLEKMNAIEDLDESAKTVTAQSGVILEHIIAAAHEKGLFLPLQFGARGSAQIGGVVCEGHSPLH